MGRESDPDRRLNLSLEEMLELVTPENRHGEVDWGPPVGREFTGDAWDECQPGGESGADPPSTPR
jgi:hypothetical protein